MKKKSAIQYAYSVTAENVGTGLIDVVGIFGEEGNEALRFRDEVQAWLDRGCSKIVVRVNSRGGCLYTAFAMYDALRAARAAACEVAAEVHGVAASAATVFLMASGTISMSENSQLMIHAPSTCVWGRLDELQDQVDALRASWKRMAEIYAERTGQPAEQLAVQLQKDTWYTAQQAIDAGFADGLVPAFDLSGEPAEKPLGGLRQAALDIAHATSSWLLPRKRVALADAQAEPGESNSAATALQVMQQRIALQTEQMGVLRGDLAKSAQELRAAQEAAAAADVRAASAEERAHKAEEQLGQERSGISARVEKAVAERLAAIPAPITPAPIEPVVPRGIADAQVQSLIQRGRTGELLEYAASSHEAMLQVTRLLSTEN